MSPRHARLTRARCRIFSAISRRSCRVLMPRRGRMPFWVRLTQVWAKRPRLSPKNKKPWPCVPLPKTHSRVPKWRSTWRASTRCWGMPITRFPFSSGCCRYRMPWPLLRRCCDSIRCGIKSATILAFRNWPKKRNCESKEILTTSERQASNFLMAAESPTHLELEIGHVLFMDVVGYSKLLTNEQREIQRQLTQIVRSTEHFRAAERAGKLIRLPVGDGMALVFFNTPEAPVQCALAVANALKAYPHLQLRMGIHSGPVSGVTDVNERSNVAGVGINMAQRVMDCGDAGHILLSSRIADDLAQQSRWRPSLHDLGPVEVKHGVKVEIVNFYTDEVGNPELPDKVKRAQEEQRAVDHRAASVSARKWSLIICLLLIVVAAAIASFWLLSHRVPPKSSAIAVSIPDKSIAVLPLDNLSEEKANAFFADGIQEELLSSLAKIKDLKVISRTSVMQYKAGITRNLKEIAQQLGVSNVIEGSVRRSGNHVRVSVQLIDALTDRHIWAQNYDRTLADSLTLQGDLATEIAAAVGATLSPQEKTRVAAKPTNNSAAYDAYLRARGFPGGSHQEGGIRLFQEAVRLDPNFVLAWAHL